MDQKSCEELLKLVTASAKRRNVLELLIEGSYEPKDINASLETTSSGILPQIKKLLENGMVRQNGKGTYAITPTRTCDRTPFRGVFGHP